MLITLLVTFVKTIAHSLLFALLPLHLLNFALPSIILDPIFEVVRSLVGIFVWIFGVQAYSFFVLTVVVVTFSFPVFRLSVFLVHFVYRVRRFF